MADRAIAALIFIGLALIVATGITGVLTSWVGWGGIVALVAGTVAGKVKGW